MDAYPDVLAVLKELEYDDEKIIAGEFFKSESKYPVNLRSIFWFLTTQSPPSTVNIFLSSAPREKKYINGNFYINFFDGCPDDLKMNIFKLFMCNATYKKTSA